MITIEVSDNTREKLNDFGKICDVDTEHMPFTGDIEIVINYSDEERHKLAKEVAKSIFEKRKEIYEELNMLERVKVMKDLEEEAFKNATDFRANYYIDEKGVFLRHKALGEYHISFNSKILHFPDAKKSIKKLKEGTHSNDPDAYPAVLEELRLLFGVLGFMQLKKEHIPREKKVSPAPAKKAARGKKKSKKKTYIYNYKYDLKDTAFNNALVTETKEGNSTNKRGYNYTVESWYTRGHWRTYQSGKRVWIKACFKSSHKTDKKEDNKTYRITKV